MLTSVSLFAGCDAATRADLAARAVVRAFAPRQRLWTAGDEPRGLFLILEGRVRIVRSGRGRDRVVHVEAAGATLGEVPLFAGGTYPATAVAAEPTRCLIVDRRALARAMAANPDLACLLLGRLAERVRLVVDRFARHATDPVVARLAAYVLARASRSGGPFTLGGTQQAVAEELGTAREVIVRLLRELTVAGALERRTRSRFVVRDARILQEFADGRPVR